MSRTSRPRRPGAAARRAAQRRRRNIWISVAAGLGLVLAGLAGWGVSQLQRSTGHPVPAQATGSGLVDGSGPVTVEIWLDLHCPHCRTFEAEAGPALAQLVADGEITRVYHPVAFLDRFSTTGYSTRAAVAIGCAADREGYLPYLSALLAAQPPPDGPGLSDDQLVQLAGSAGLAGPEFAGCVADQRYEGWVDQVTADASRVGVNATPTVRVAGQDVAPSVEAISAAVQAAGSGAGS
jgi:protein-disulfide isomerase